MSDIRYDVFQHYGTSAERLAFTPNPAAGIQPLYVWYETDTGSTYVYHTAWALVAGSGATLPPFSFLASGGQVVWITGFDFTVSAATYYINGFQYTSPQTDITLDAPDPSDPRIDLFIVDNTGTVSKITGVASATPSEPSINPGTQLKIGFILVPASSSDPGTTNEILYAENTGAPAEYNWSTSGSGFNVNSTNDPRTGTKDIEGTAVASAAYAQGEKGTGTFDPNTSQLLALYIKSKAAWASNRTLSISLRLSGVQVGTPVVIQRTGSFGFDSSITASYQLVAIPTTLFAVPAGSTINQIRITAGGSGHGFYIDDVFFQLAGAGGPGTSGITQAEGDARYLQRANNLSDLTSTTTARTNLGLGAIALLDVVEEANMALNDTTSLNVNISRHGFAPKLSNVATQFLDGTGGWTVPTGSGINQLTGEVTAGPGSGSQTATITSGAVTNTKLANVNQNTIKGRISSGAGVPEDLVGSQATSILSTFVGDTGSGGVKGLVPSPASGDAAAGKFLNAGGSWTVPPTESVARIFYLDDDASDIATYHVLLGVPAGGTEVIDSQAVVVGDGELLIEAYASNSPFGVTELPAGDWIFRLYRYVSSATGLSEIVIRVYKRTVPGGVETELFNCTTGNIDDTTVTLQNITSTQTTHTVNATDRLVVKYFAKTDSVVSRTLYFTHNGATHYSSFVTPFAAPVSDFIGDSGSGGVRGLVPAPAAGDGAAGKYLAADGSWDIPSGTGTGDVVGPSSSTDGHVVLFDGATGKLIKSSNLPYPTSSGIVGIVIDGGGSAITTGVKGFVRVPTACTISKATVLSIDASATSGSIVIDVWKDSYANYPPTDADSITASAPPTLTTANKSEDSTLTGWTKTITAGDVLGFNVDSASTVTKVLLELEVTF